MSGTVHNDGSGAQIASAPPSYRFPRTNKLLKHALFDQVYQRGQRHFSGLMTVFFLKRDGAEVSLAGTAPGGPRIGLTVGRVLGPSVERNRIRRRMREAVRLNLHRLMDPVDVVINPKKAVLTAEFTRIAEEVQKAFEAIGRRMEEGWKDEPQPRPRTRERGGSRKRAPRSKSA